MLRELVKNERMYGYNVDYWQGSKGIVIAENEDDARTKVSDRYLKQGYSESELSELEVWAITEDSFVNSEEDVLEIWK